MKKNTPLREGRLYVILTLAFVVLAGADILYYTAGTPDAETSALPLTLPPETMPEPVASAYVCQYNAEIPVVENHAQLVNDLDFVKGRANAPVTVVEFFEPNCPHCRTFFPVMKEVMEANAEVARFVIKPVIFWPKSTLQGQALYAAQQEGKFLAMLEAQFANPRPNGLAEAELRQLAEGVGMNADAMMQQINDRGYTQHMYRMREAFQLSGNNSVPAVLINGRTVDGNSRTASCLTKLIQEAAAQP